MTDAAYEICNLEENEIDEVNGAWLLAAATLVGGAMAVVYAGEVIHDLTCDDHDEE